MVGRRQRVARVHQRELILITATLVLDEVEVMLVARRVGSGAERRLDVDGNAVRLRRVQAQLPALQGGGRVPGPAAWARRGRGADPGPEAGVPGFPALQGGRGIAPGAGAGARAAPPSMLNSRDQTGQETKISVSFGPFLAVRDGLDYDLAVTISVSADLRPEVSCRSRYWSFSTSLGTAAEAGAGARAAGESQLDCPVAVEDDEPQRAAARLEGS